MNSETEHSILKEFVLESSDLKFKSWLLRMLTVSLVMMWLLLMTLSFLVYKTEMLCYKKRNTYLGMIMLPRILALRKWRSNLDFEIK